MLDDKPTSAFRRRFTFKAALPVKTAPFAAINGDPIRLTASVKPPQVACMASQRRRRLTLAVTGNGHAQPGEALIPALITDRADKIAGGAVKDAGHTGIEAMTYVPREAAIGVAGT